jgi:hypothetical protein
MTVVRFGLPKYSDPEKKGLGRIRIQIDRPLDAYPDLGKFCDPTGC